MQRYFVDSKEFAEYRCTHTETIGEDMEPYWYWLLGVVAAISLFYLGIVLYMVKKVFKTMEDV